MDIKTKVPWTLTLRQAKLNRQTKIYEKSLL